MLPQLRERFPQSVLRRGFSSLRDLCKRRVLRRIRRSRKIFQGCQSRIRFPRDPPRSRFNPPRKLVSLFPTLLFPLMIFIRPDPLLDRTPSPADKRSDLEPFREGSLRDLPIDGSRRQLELLGDLSLCEQLLPVTVAKLERVGFRFRFCCHSGQPLYSSDSIAIDEVVERSIRKE